MEISQYFGDDLMLTPEGDIAVSEGDELARQSIIRRLLTNPGTYIWHPDYGAGISRFIGQNLSTDNFDEIKNLITSQMLLEETVSPSPPPQITLKIVSINILQCDIVYQSAITKNPVSISFQVS